MILQIVYYLCLICVISAVQYLPNVDCGPYVDYIATDPGNHRYTPYYVKLHRCHGTNIAVNPQNKNCVPKTTGTKELEIFVFSVRNGGQSTTVKVLNETACHEECILKADSCTPYQTYEPNDCACLCDYTSSPTPTTCSKPFYWDQSSCNCKCQHKTLACDKRKEFNEEVCGCQCKEKFRVRCANRKEYLDENTCTCVDPTVITGAAQGQCEGDIKGGILAVVMIIEALAFLIAYFFLYSYCYKRKYLEKKKSKQNSFHQQNGNISYNSHNTYPTEFNAISVEASEETDDMAKCTSDDKKLIEKEEQNGNRPTYPPVYDGDEVKSQLSSQRDDEWYVYGKNHDSDDSLQNGSTSTDRLLHPPDYTDYVSSELSEDGYGSVTQV